MGFHDRLAKAWSLSGSMLCVGLDPDPAALPKPLDGSPDAIERFCTTIVDATADLVCAFKPQIAHFASQRAEPALERGCRYIRERYPDVVLVLDAKRGDLGASVRAGSSAPGVGLLCSSSRAILYASGGDDFADAARAAALETRDAINAAAG
jgi:orotidine-5'-phosphate decarboxylase